MDRDPRGNSLEPVGRVSPTSGANDTGDAGDEEARIDRERQDGGRGRDDERDRPDASSGGKA